MANMCNVCCNKSKTIITCCACDYMSCRKCTERYILESPSDVPQCMNCKVDWHEDFMFQSMSKTFMNQKLKTKWKQVLFEKEKAWIPETQHFADLTRQINEVNEQIKSLRVAIKHEPQDSNLQDMITNLNIRKHHLQADMEKEPTRFKGKVIPCPVEGCKGFIDINTTSCGLCHSMICTKCHISCDHQHIHVCRQEDLDSLKLIQKETKPCPNCGTPCFKVDGCDQVFARCCLTTFSWSTGEIDKGKIHAPDYFSWLRTTNANIDRDVNDIPCGGIPQITHIHLEMFTPIQATELISIYHLVERIQNSDIPFYRDKVIFTEKTNRDLRIRYMIDPKMTEDHFKTQLAKREKQRLIRKQVFIVIMSAFHSLVDVLQRCTEDTCRPKTIMSEFHNLRDVFNAQLDQLRDNYMSPIIPYISIDWILNYHF